MQKLANFTLGILDTAKCYHLPKNEVQKHNIRDLKFKCVGVYKYIFRNWCGINFVCGHIWVGHPNSAHTIKISPVQVPARLKIIFLWALVQIKI